MMNDISKAYSSPVFVAASRRQRGGGFFGRIARFAIPILKNIGATVGKEALNFASNTLSDVSQGKPFKQAVRRRGLNSLINVSNKFAGNRPRKRPYLK